MKIVSNRPTITRKELEMVLDCLMHNELTTGSMVKVFETNLSGIIEQKYALATNSLTSAYHLIFHALQIKGDDEIIIPSFFNQAPLSALSLTGGKAVLVDNDENSLFPSPASIKEKINEKTKGVIIGHTFGSHFDIEALKDITIPIIEDISHAVGTESNERKVGSIGSFAILSSAPSMIITTGNGAMIMTNNSKHYSQMRDMRGSYDDRLHFDYTMTDFQGAMGISQLLKLKDLIKRRREIAKIYYDSLKITSHKTPMHYNEHYAYQTFPVLFDAPAEKTDKYWKKNGIEVTLAMPSPLHTILGLKGLDYPNSDRLAKKLFSIPIYPTLSKKDIEKISTVLARFI